MASRHTEARATGWAPPKMPPPTLVRAVESVRSGLLGVRARMAPPFAGVLDLAMGYAVSQAVHAAARLAIADVLVDGPLTVERIAERINADAQALRRLLRVLAAHRVFRERRDGRFEMTPMSHALRSDARVSIRPLLMMLSHPFYQQHFGQLTEVVRSGRTSIESTYGMGLFDCLERDSDTADVFNEAMTCVTAMAIPPLLAAYDFSSARTIVDVGGGSGQLLAAVLTVAPDARGVLFEQSSLKDRAQQLFEAAGVADRASVETGSFFDAVPDGGDLYLLKHVVHDWEDAQAARILRTVREAMSPDAKLLLAETVIPPGNTAHFGKLLDLDMLVFAGGRERTSQEFADLLTTSGFTPPRVIPTAMHLSLIEAMTT
ncbi:methyltransferase [Mycolicibacterium thermoresistibile]